MNATAIDKLLQNAFSLAFFIHGDKETALRVVVGAMAKLDVALTAQYKRYYYAPIGRSTTRRGERQRLRNKVFFSDPHVLQRLIFIESEAYERERENCPSRCNQEDLVISFVKHLVKITTRRNAFYVTLGLSRLLYNYSTIETMNIYNVVVQDPDCVKDDHYYRSRKARLMREIKDRFGDHVKICRGPRGEERFHADESSEKLASLVKECLAFFTPWDTACLVPNCFDSSSRLIAPLAQNGQEDDRVEINRIHAVLHPECFKRLIGSVGLDHPDKRLRVPQLYLTEDNYNGQGGERRQPPKLIEEELSGIKAELARQAARRREFATGLLRIIVDGAELGRLDLSRSSRTRLELDQSSELIEIWSAGLHETLLGSYLLPDREDGEARQAKAGIVLEQGQELTIDIHETESSSLVLEVVYREAHLSRALGSFLTRTIAALSDRAGEYRGHRLGPVALGLCFFLLIAAVLSIGLYVRSTRRRVEQPRGEIVQQADPMTHKNLSESKQSSNVSEAPTPDTPEKERKGLPDGSRPSPVPQLPGPVAPRNLERQVEKETVARSQDNANNEIKPQKSGSERESTRDVPSTAAVTSLAAVKTIHVECVGDDALGLMVVDELRKRTKFEVTDRRENAEALLKIRVRTRRAERVNLEVQAVNVRGEVIWPKSGGRYQGPATSVASKIVGDLKAEQDHQ